MTIRTTFASASVTLTDAYIAANYPGGDTDVFTELRDKLQTIATNRSWTIDDATWSNQYGRVIVQGGVEYQISTDYGADISTGARFRVFCRATKDVA